MELGILVDVAVGVLAVLVLFSIATSAVNEFVGDWIFRLRGKALAQAIEKLLAREAGRAGADPSVVTPRGLRDAFFADPDIRVLMNGDRLPSAIEARRYALTVLKMLSERHELKAALDARIDAAHRESNTWVDTVAEVAGTDAGEVLAERLGKGVAAVKRLGAESVETVDAVLKRLEGEFDELMDRVSGWYLRRTKVMLFAIGLVLAVGSNIDLLGHADRMLTEGDVRSRIDSLAELVESGELQALIERHDRREQMAVLATVAGKPLGDEEGEVRTAMVPSVAGDAARADLFDPKHLTDLDREIGDILNQFGDFNVKVGWDCVAVPGDRAVLIASARYCLWRTGQAAAGQSLADARSARLGLPVPTTSQAIGWVLIAFGVTFGAQMWFDLVKRLVRLRTSGLTGGVATRPEG